MTGYIGYKARKRKRNFILLLLFVLVFGLIVLVFPQIDFYENNPAPEDSI